MHMQNQIMDTELTLRVRVLYSTMTWCLEIFRTDVCSLTPLLSSALRSRLWKVELPIYRRSFKSEQSFNLCRPFSTMRHCLRKDSKHRNWGPSWAQALMVRRATTYSMISLTSSPVDHEKTTLLAGSFISPALSNS
jgi:hypothetical protein